MRTDRQDREGNVYDFHWDSKREGFYISINSKPVKGLFYKAKGIFDRSDAQEQAKKMMIKLVVDAINSYDKAKQHEYQYVKPLTQLEQEWVELENRFMQLNDKELQRWKNLGEVVRKSLIDGSHPSVKHRKV